MCHYRLSGVLTAMAFAENQPDEINELRFFAEVGPGTKGGITKWVNAMAVASYLGSPHAPPDERLATIQLLAAIVRAPAQPVEATLRGIKDEAFVSLQLTGRVKHPKG